MYEFDIHCSDKFMTQFKLDNNIPSDLIEYHDIFNYYFTKVNSPLFLIHDYKINEQQNIKTLELNDAIKVEYIPCSQKYYKYYNKKNVCGKLFYLHKDNGLLYRDEKINNEMVRIVQTIETEYCSFYCDTKGYDLIIHKLC